MISTHSAYTYSDGKTTGSTGSGIRLSIKPPIPLLSHHAIMENLLKCQWPAFSTNSVKTQTLELKSSPKVMIEPPISSPKLLNISVPIKDYMSYFQICGLHKVNHGRNIKYIYKGSLSPRIHLLNPLEFLVLQPVLGQTSSSSMMLLISEMQSKIQNYVMLSKKLSSLSGSTYSKRVEDSFTSVHFGIEMTYHTHLLQWMHTIQYFIQFPQAASIRSGKNIGLEKLWKKDVRR